MKAIIVPFIAEARAKREDVGAFVGRVLGMSVVGLAAITVMFLAVIRPILSILTRFSPQGIDLIYWILFESSPLIILLCWTSALAGTLNA